MKVIKHLVVLMLFLVSVVAMTGCVDKKQFAEVQETQKEIIERLERIEKDQKQFSKMVRPKRPSVDPNKVHDIPLGSSPVKGGMQASVTIVEFSDFQCPYCSKLQPTLDAVLKAYPEDVRLVYKHFPLPFHQQAKNAAKASLAAGEQGKFWEMHDIIFENYNSLSPDKLKSFAAKLGLDTNKFAKDFESSKYEKLIKQDMALGKSIGVGGTPTLFINGKRMQNRSLDYFKQTIDGILKK